MPRWHLTVFAACSDFVLTDRHIQRVLEHGGLRPVYQPICKLNNDRTVVGYEALSRFPIQPDVAMEDQTPAKWFSRACDTDLGEELEIMAIAQAIPVIPRITPCYISVNASASTLLLDNFADIVLTNLPQNIVLELTEHDVILTYTPLLEVLERLRGTPLLAVGHSAQRVEDLARLAIDDVGAGHSGLARIINLHPDILKLDRSLVEDVDVSPIKAALIAGMVIFAAAMKITLVAEGIETESEFEALRVLGVDCGQGWYLGRPEPFAVGALLG